MDENGITRIAQYRCPYCGHTVDAVGTTSGEHHAPTPGDWCGCIACGGLEVFCLDNDGQLTLRPMTDAEIAALPDDARREFARLDSFAKHFQRMERARGAGLN